VTSASVEELNLSSVRFRPDLGCRSLTRMIKLSYSELHIGAPHPLLLRRFFPLFLMYVGENSIHIVSSLRFSDNVL